MAEAVELLEAGLPERLRERIEAFEAMHPDAKQSGDPMVRRAGRMLAEMREQVLGGSSQVEQTAV